MNQLIFTASHLKCLSQSHVLKTLNFASLTAVVAVVAAVVAAAAAGISDS